MLRSPGTNCKKQKGFTLVEMVIGLAIIGIVGAAAATGITQVFSGSTLSNNRMTAINNVRNAGDWISQDARMAQNSVILDVPGVLMRITWEYYPPPSGEPPVTYSVDYTLSGTNLQRSYQSIKAGPPPEIVNKTVMVAQNITVTAGPSFVGNKLTITLTATVGSASETRTFDIGMRNLPQ